MSTQGRICFICLACLVWYVASMYLWSKHHFGRVAGVVASLFYVYAPYRAVDAYVRGALAEAFAFVWLPLILLSIDHLFEELRGLDKKKSIFYLWTSQWVWILAASYALLMVTHNLICLPFTILMVLYALSKTIHLNWHQNQIYLGKLIIAGLIGLGLSAFFWLPALTEKSFTLVDNILLQERYTYSLHFVCPSQLWNSLWGYGGSAEGCLDGVSFKIGKVHIIATVAAILLSLVVVTLRLIRPKLPVFTKNVRNIPKTRLSLILSSGLLFFFSAWMTTTYSNLVWSVFKPLQFLQFPWRFLSFAALFSSLLVGSLVWLVWMLTKLKWLQWLIALGLLIVLFIPNIKLFQPQTYLDVNDNHYTSEEFTKWTTSKTSFEFVPKDVETTVQSDLDITQLAITRDQIATQPVIDVNNTQMVSNTPSYKKIITTYTVPSILTFNSFYFPGWQLTIDGVVNTINHNNRLQLIAAQVPAGTHTVEITFTNTPVITLANSISFLCLLILIALITRPLWQKRQ